MKLSLLLLVALAVAMATTAVHGETVAVAQAEQVQAQLQEQLTAGEGVEDEDQVDDEDELDAETEEDEEEDVEAEAEEETEVEDTESNEMESLAETDTEVRVIRCEYTDTKTKQVKQGWCSHSNWGCPAANRRADTNGRCLGADTVCCTQTPTGQQAQTAPGTTANGRVLKCHGYHPKEKKDYNGFCLEASKCKKASVRGSCGSNVCCLSSPVAGRTRVQTTPTRKPPAKRKP